MPALNISHGISMQNASVGSRWVLWVEFVGARSQEAITQCWWSCPRRWISEMNLLLFWMFHTTLIHFLSFKSFNWQSLQSPWTSILVLHAISRPFAKINHNIAEIFLGSHGCLCKIWSLIHIINFSQSIVPLAWY